MNARIAAVAIGVTASVAGFVATRSAPPRIAPDTSALVGAWVLDTVRTHYGPSAERRRWEHFTCEAMRDGGVRCTIDGERADGRRVSGQFTATIGEAPAPVTGVPGVDAMRLRAVDPTIADATFYSRGAAVLGYRAYRAPDGRALVIVSVDPVSRAALSSVVVYSRR